MRLPLLLTVLISVAAPAYADGVRESRYGPTTPRQETAAVVRYDGPMLGWSNKRQASTVAIAPPAAIPTQPAQLARWAGYQATPAPAAYTPLPTAPLPPPPAPAPPTSLYATPRPAPVASAPPPPVATSAATPVAAKDWSSYRSTRVSGIAPVAVTPPTPAPPPPRQVAVANTGTANIGTTGARYYSVDREYGLTPDAAPPPGPDNRVLVTASEPPPEPKDATPIHGSADWLAAGVAGDDDQDSDSASRRAKSRNEAL